MWTKFYTSIKKWCYSTQEFDVKPQNIPLLKNSRKERKKWHLPLWTIYNNYLSQCVIERNAPWGCCNSSLVCWENSNHLYHDVSTFFPWYIPSLIAMSSRMTTLLSTRRKCSELNSMIMMLKIYQFILYNQAFRLSV